MKPLYLYQQQIAAINKQRAALDLDFAQVLAEGVADGHSILGMIDPPTLVSKPRPQRAKKLDFDL